MTDKPTQVAQLIREAVASGEYPPGSRIPSHRKLAELYGVGVETADRAVQLLLDEGLIVASHLGQRHEGFYVAFTRVVP